MLPYLTALFYFDGETVLAACDLRAITKKSSTFLRKKVHPGDLAGGFSDLEMTWLLYCAGAATVINMNQIFRNQTKTTYFFHRAKETIASVRLARICH